MATETLKSCLDSSVVRPLLLGTQAYQSYLESQLGNTPRHISPYVAMEIKRSYLRNVIKFYFTLRLPTIQTISDALTFWSNHYQGSKHKAVEQLVAQLLSQQAFSSMSSNDKAPALKILGAYILQFVTALNTEFVYVEYDSTHCTRAQVPLQLDHNNLAEGLKQFIDDFDDLETCRDRCRIDEFLLVDRRTSLETYIHQAQHLSQTPENRGFLKLANNLKEILNRGAAGCSCKRCERIGDVVIALDASRTMQLEHVDYAFNYLCPPINQPHRQHPSEVQIISR